MGATKTLEDTITTAEKSKRIPDFQLLLTETMDGEHIDSQLCCWAEIKPLAFDDWTPGKTTFERVGRILQATIPQVNDQAAHAFRTIPKGDVFYAFILIATSFTLLRYTRPTPSTASSSQSESGSDDQPDTLVMPGPPEVIHWEGEITNVGTTAFTREFRDALHQVLSPLGIELQPSWFQKDERGFGARRQQHLRTLRVSAVFQYPRLSAPLMTERLHIHIYNRNLVSVSSTKPVFQMRNEDLMK